MVSTGAVPPSHGEAWGKTSGCFWRHLYTNTLMRRVWERSLHPLPALRPALCHRGLVQQMSRNTDTRRHRHTSFQQNKGKRKLSVRGGEWDTTWAELSPSSSFRKGFKRNERNTPRMRLSLRHPCMSLRSSIWAFLRTLQWVLFILVIIKKHREWRDYVQLLEINLAEWCL